MIIHNPILTGSFTVNGTDVSSITSSAASLTSLNSYTASQNNRNGTYATTGSNTFAGIQTVNSNLVVTGSITAQTLVVQTITSSVDFVTGSTRFGSITANTHTFTGSIFQSGSTAYFSGNILVNTGSNIGSNARISILNGPSEEGIDIRYLTTSSFSPIAVRDAVNDVFQLNQYGRLYVSGSIGVGTTTPSGKLDVQAPGTSAFSYYFRNSAGGYGGGVYNTGANNTQLYLATSAGTENVLIAATGSSYFNGGNVGIGTNNPSNILTVASVQNLSVFRSTTTTNYVELQLENTTNYLQIGIEGGTGNRMGGTIAYNSYLGSYNNYGMTFHTNNLNRMTITNGGNVGIGITGPSHKLSIVDSSFNQYSLRLESNSGNTLNRWGGIGFAGEGSNTKAAILFVSEGGSYSRGHLVFANNNDFNQNSATLSDERMRITSGGELYWAATGTGGTDISNGAILFRSNAGQKYMQVNHGVDGDSTLIYFYRKSGSSVTNVGSISTSGNSIVYNTTSDYRIKEDFKDINGLEKVSAIKVYDFKFKGIENRMDGVIAHELAEILPYAVTGEKDAIDEEGNIRAQSVDYSKIVPVLVKAIQELKAEIEILKNK